MVTGDLLLALPVDSGELELELDDSPEEDPVELVDEPELLIPDGELITLIDGLTDGLLMFCTLTTSGVVISDNGDGNRFNSAIRN